jgi:hypothetical protein
LMIYFSVSLTHEGQQIFFHGGEQKDTIFA